jgi:hypothetical protein
MKFQRPFQLIDQLFTFDVVLFSTILIWLINSRLSGKNVPLFVFLILAISIVLIMSYLVFYRRHKIAVHDKEIQVEYQICDLKIYSRRIINLERVFFKLSSKEMQIATLDNDLSVPQSYSLLVVNASDYKERLVHPYFPIRDYYDFVKLVLTNIRHAKTDKESAEYIKTQDFPVTAHIEIVSDIR